MATDPNAARCPQCGGQLEIPSGARLLRCSFCDCSLYIEAAGVVRHYLLPRRLDEAQAREALRRWMAGNETVKDLDRQATLGSVSAISFPMWLFRAQSAKGEIVRVEPAAPTPVPQLADLKVPAGELTLFGSGERAAETVAAGVPLETARAWLGPLADAITETALVHIPLWRCEYAYRGKAFVAWAEAATGEVMAAVFPAKAEAPYIGVAAVGLVLFGVLGLWIGNPILKILAYGAAALPLLGLAYLVTRKI